jgi:uncharacterized membrane protein YccC
MTGRRSGSSHRPGTQISKVTAWDFIYAVDMAIACALSYAIITQLLVRFVDEPTKLLGAMWAMVATVFVFKGTRASTLSAAVGRFIATCVSFALCLIYLLIFPVTGPGIAVVIGLGTVIMMLLGRRDDLVTAGITTTVVLVVAAMSPEQGWQQPVFRFVDTLVGILVGVSCKWFASYVFYKALGEPVR